MIQPEDELTTVRHLLQEALGKLAGAEGELGQLRAERSERILHVFGCAGCNGEHRGIWTQYLNPPATIMHMGTAAQIECQRAYVCPTERTVVLVSDESEDTFNG